MDSFIKKYKGNYGFTMPEVLIVVAILAIVFTMAFPDFVNFFQIEKSRTDRANMLEIQEALEAFAEDNGTLPAVATWSVQLQPYTKLSANDIASDAWNSPRVYQTFVNNVNFRDGNFNVSYGAVASLGEDLAWNGGAAVSVTTIAAVADYQALVATGDDSIVKYTNYQSKIKDYELTAKRISSVSSALASASQRQFNIASADYETYCAGLVGAGAIGSLPPMAGLGGLVVQITARGIGQPAFTDIIECYDDIVNAFVLENLIFYPDASGTADGAVYSAYAANISPAIDSTNADPATRRAAMTALMGALGLPLSSCCSAMNNAADGLPDPFYYYPNPACAGLNNTKLSPQVLTVPLGAGC